MDCRGRHDDPAGRFEFHRLAIERDGCMSLLYQQNLHEMVVSMNADFPIVERASFSNCLDMRKAARCRSLSFTIKRIAGNRLSHVPKVPSVCPAVAFLPIPAPVK